MQNQNCCCQHTPLAAKKVDWTNYSIDEEPQQTPIPVSQPILTEKLMNDSNVKATLSIVVQKKEELVGKKKFLANITSLFSNGKYTHGKENASLVSKYMSNTLESEPDESVDFLNHKSCLQLKPADKSIDISILNKSLTNKSLREEPRTLKKKCPSLANVRSNFNTILTDKKVQPEILNRSNSCAKSLNKSSTAKSRKLMFDLGGKEFELGRSSSRKRITMAPRFEGTQNKKILEHFKQQGVERREKKVQRKEMEDQMTKLQNRIKKLQIEQEVMKKQLKKTEQMTQMTILAKQRHLNDLVSAESMKLEKLKNEEKTREQIYIEKKEQKESLKQKVSQIAKEKIAKAKTIRETIQELEEKKKENIVHEVGKKLVAHKKTIESEKKVKEMKMRTVLAQVGKNQERHFSILDQEEKKTSKLQEKIKEMAKVEEILIDQIKTTFQVKESMEERMRRIAATKVNPHQILELADD